MHSAGLLQAMRTTCYMSPYGARCSPVIRKFSTAVIGASLHVLLKFIFDVFALIYSHDVSYQIMHQYRSSAHRCFEICGVILWSPCRFGSLSSLSLENRQTLPVADANDRFSGRLSIMFSCVIVLTFIIFKRLKHSWFTLPNIAVICQQSKTL